MRAPSTARPARRLVLGVLGIAVGAAGALGILYGSLRPEPGSAVVVGKAPAHPATTPTGTPGTPSEAQSLAGTWSLRCPAPLDDGPVRFVRMERWSAGAWNARVDRGQLSATTDVVEGEGDLVRNGSAPVRLTWSPGRDGAPNCSVAAARPAVVQGLVRDADGLPAEGVVVAGCEERARTDASGRWSLTTTTGRVCKLRALGSGPDGVAVSEVREVQAPGSATLDLDDLRSPEDLARDLQNALAALDAMAVVGGPSSDDDPRDRISAALASGDPDRVTATWLGLR